MKKNAEQILQCYSDAKPIKDRYDDVCREIFMYTMPNRSGYDKEASEGTSKKTFQNTSKNLYTSVGINSGEEFVGTFQSTLCPVQAKWIKIEAGAVFEAQGTADHVNKELEKLSNLANYYKNISNYDVAFNEFAYDMIAGTATMLCVEGSQANPLRFSAVPLIEYCIDEGVEGEPSSFYRSMCKSREITKHTWKELSNMPVTADNFAEKINLLEYCYKDYDKNVFYYGVINKDEKTIMFERTYRNSPFITLRANKPAGEIYGRGDGLKALADLKMLNQTLLYSIQNFAMAIGFFLASHDEDLDEIDFQPLSINRVDDPQLSLNHVSLPANFDITAYNIENMSLNIKRTMKGNTLPNDGTVVKTATEVSARMQELNKSLINWVGRCMTEYQTPIIKRIFEVLDSFGYLGENNMFKESDIDGLFYKVKINSPLSKALKAQEIDNITQGISMLMNFDESGSIAGTVLKIKELAIELMQLVGMPLKFVNTLEEIQQMEEKKAMQAEAIQQQAMQADVQVSNAKEEGKANASQ